MTTMRTMRKWITGTLVAPAAGLALVAWSGQAAHAAPTLTIVQRNTTNLGTGTTAGQMSGLTWLGGNNWVAVADARNEVLPLSVTIDPATGNATSVIPAAKQVLGGASHDYEGIAWTGPTRNTFLVSEEDTPAVHEFNPTTLTEVSASPLPTPSIFTGGNTRTNLGFESMTIRSSNGTAYTANEEALVSDGAEATSTAGTLVRIQSYTPSASTYAAGPQYAYRVDPVHGSNSNGATTDPQSGLSDLVALPNGIILTLERSVYWTGTVFGDLPNFQSRIYEIDLNAATPIADPNSSLSSQTVAEVPKTLLWSGSVQNLEGLALGGATNNGYSLLGISDNQDSSLLQTQLLAFELTGNVPEPGSVALLAVAAFFGGARKWQRLCVTQRT